MSTNKDRWSALSLKDRADLMNMYITSGISDLKEMKKHYNSFAPGGPIEVDEYGYPADITPAVVEADYPRENEVWKRADSSNADMIQRLKQGSSRVTIPDWEDPRKIATHKMMSAGKYAVGNVQNINGQLFDFTDPKHGFKDSNRAAIDSAIKRRDYVEFDTEGDARYFAEHYKKHYNSFSGEENTTNKDIIYYDDTYIEPAVVKAFNSNEDYNRYYGEQFGKKIADKTNNVAQSVFEGLQYVPLLGDILDAESAAVNAYNGNYKEAAALGALTLLPNFIEKPIKGLKKGFKNIALYNKYMQDPERFRSTVNTIMDRYARNADILDANHGGTAKKRVLNTAEDIINAKNNSITITTDPVLLFARKKGGAYSNGTIWLNPYSKGILKTAWKSPKEAIKQIHGVAGHEGTHAALDFLNDNLTIYDPKRGYHRANPKHPLYQEVGYIFDDMGRKTGNWERSPEEFISEINSFRIKNNIPSHLGYNQWEPTKKKALQKYMARRFNISPKDASYIAPEDIDYILTKYSDFGYKNGGRLLTKKQK